MFGKIITARLFFVLGIMALSRASSGHLAFSASPEMVSVTGASTEMVSVAGASPEMVQFTGKVTVPRIPHCNNREDDMTVNMSRASLSIVYEFVNHQLQKVENISKENVNLTCDDTEIIARVAAAELVIIGNDYKPYLLMPDAFCRFSTTINFCIDVEAMKMNSPEDEQKPLEHTINYCTEDFSFTKSVCDNVSCIRKCCKGEESTQLWEPKFASGKTVNHKVIFGKPDCNQTIIWGEHFNLLDDGSVSIDNEIYNTNQYCINDENMKDILHVCFEVEDPTCEWISSLQLYMTVVSCVCLTCCLVLYAINPRMRRPRLQASCMMSMIISQLFAILAFQTNRMTRETKYGALFCSSIAVTSLVFFLAMFFWLNVISFNLYHTNWNGIDMRQFGRWFICYNIYAWGCPVVVGLVAVLMDTLKPSGAALPYFVSPNCWFRDKASAWAYMYGIVLVLLMVNLCLFIHLAYRFKRMFNVQPSATRPRQFGLRLRVHLTLMVIMGLGWAGELRVTNFTSCNWRSAAGVIVSNLQGVLLLLLQIFNLRKQRLMTETRRGTNRMWLGDGSNRENCITRL